MFLSQTLFFTCKQRAFWAASSTVPTYINASSADGPICLRKSVAAFNRIVLVNVFAFEGR